MPNNYPIAAKSADRLPKFVFQNPASKSHYQIALDLSKTNSGRPEPLKTRRFCKHRPDMQQHRRLEYLRTIGGNVPIMPKYISVDSLAAVRIGALWVPANKIPEALARFTRVLFCMTGVDDQPYAFRGSATALKWKDHHLLFCCRHQFSDYEPNDVVVPIDKVGKILVSGSAFTEIIAQPGNTGEELLDICSMSFVPENYGSTNVERNFFDIKSADVWQGDTDSTFIAFGYPTSLRNLGFEDTFGALNNIKTMMVVVGATYGAASNSKHTHSICLQKTGDYGSDGLSGGPVFHLAQDAQGFYCGFAGLITRGSETSNYLHFVDVRTMRDFFIFQENKTRTSERQIFDLLS